MDFNRWQLGLINNVRKRFSSTSLLWSALPHLQRGDAGITQRLYGPSTKGFGTFASGLSPPGIPSPHWHPSSPEASRAFQPREPGPGETPASGPLSLGGEKPC